MLARRLGLWKSATFTSRSFWRSNTAVQCTGIKVFLKLQQNICVVKVAIGCGSFAMIPGFLPVNLVLYAFLADRAIFRGIECPELRN